MVNRLRDVVTYEHLKTPQPSATGPSHSFVHFVFHKRSLTVQQFSRLTSLDHFVQQAPAYKSLDSGPAGTSVGCIWIFGTYKFAVFLERWLYLSKISVPGFARCVTFRVIPVWSRCFGLITGRNRCASVLRPDVRDATSHNIPCRQRSTYDREIRLMERLTLLIPH